MLNANERNFATFYPHDNPAELANEMLPEVADLVGVELGDGHDPEAYGQLIGKLGAHKVLRENPTPLAIDLEKAAAFVAESGIQNPLDRAWQDPEMPTPQGTELVTTGAVANWQDRIRSMLLETNEFSDPNRFANHRLWIAAGNRRMTSGTETTHPSVRAYYEDYGSYPTEAEYADMYIRPSRELTGIDTYVERYETTKGDVVAQRFVEDHQALFAPEHKITTLHVAGAGVQWAAHLRNAARTANPNYDTSADPQLFMITDEMLPLASSEAELANPKEYQNPYTALRQVAVTAKMLAVQYHA